MTNAEIAALLLAVRRGEAPPAQIDIGSDAQAYAVQRLVMAGLGPIGGWKVGAASPSATPGCAPMPARFVAPAPCVFDAALFPQREVESEICFTFTRSLPPRATPYERSEVLSAIATCQPGMEVLQSRLRAPADASPCAMLADFAQHGGFAFGAPIEPWRALDFDTISVRQTIEGTPVIERTGNPAGDMVRLMVWLANTGAVWAGGIEAGQIVTCGSWTGKAYVPPGSEGVAAFACASPVKLRFAPM
jgi:2-keto-4-pentenoate hydratase